MNQSNTHANIAWKSYADVPAIRASILVSFFFAAAFLSYGFLLLFFVAYAFVAVRAARKGRGSLVSKLIQSLSFETAVLIFGLAFELCFRAWKPGFSSLHTSVRALAWLSFAAVLLSTKFILITHAIDAWLQPKYMALKAKKTAHVIVAFALLIASVACLTAAIAGPLAMNIPSFLGDALTPGIL